MHLLAIDVGNTTVKLGLFRGAEPVRHWRLATRRHKLADDYRVAVRALFRDAGIDAATVTGCVLASVVPILTPRFEQLAREAFGVAPLVVTSRIRHGLVLDGRPLDELGADRVANCVAALDGHAGPGPVGVVALGTATAVDVVARDGRYLGGAIAPGMAVAAESLFASAAMLAQVELREPPAALALNTADQLRSGLVLGFAGLVDGLLERMQREVGGPFPVLATGGDAELLAPACRHVTRVEPDLTLRGLVLLHARLA